MASLRDCGLSFVSLALGKAKLLLEFNFVFPLEETG